MPIVKAQRDEVLERLTEVFRCTGYEGASLVRLAEAAGLKKASLYHRFPGGKEEMAQAVLGEAGAWLEAHVLAPLAADAPPRERLLGMLDAVGTFYDGGRKACLLETFSLDPASGNPLATAVRAALEAWRAALARCLEAAGRSPAAAEREAETFLAHLQGALVLTRGLGTTGPFERMLGQYRETWGAQGSRADS